MPAEPSVLRKTLRTRTSLASALHSLFPNLGLFAILAVVLIAPHGLAQQDDDTQPEGVRRVRFLSYNVHNYVLTPAPGDTRVTAKPLREVEALVDFLVETKPDILGVSEMGQPSDLKDLQLRLEKRGLNMPESEWIDGPDKTRHLALLSRFPIVSRQSKPDVRYLLDEEVFPVQRGFLDVTVEVGAGYHLRLVGAHLKSRRDVPEGDQDTMRRYEAHELRRHLDTILTADPEVNLLVYGDMNDTKDSPGIRELHGLSGTPGFLRDVPVEDARGERWTYYHEPGDEYSRIDYIFASGGLVPEIRTKECSIPANPQWKEASDHRPLLIAISPFEGRKRP
jgi:endonuclease/exonuclease/phosphatase family metal-dependent hydrolase